MVREDGELGDQLRTLSLRPFAPLRFSEVRDSLAKAPWASALRCWEPWCEGQQDAPDTARALEPLVFLEGPEVPLGRRTCLCAGLRPKQQEVAAAAGH